jgi:hypothetical protein
MGDRDRYYDRNEGRSDRDQTPYRAQREPGSWEQREDYARSSGRERGGEYGRDYGAAQDYRNYGSSQGTYESRRSARGYGDYDEGRNYERDWERKGFEPERRYVSGETQRNSWNDRGSTADMSYGRNYGGGYRDPEARFSSRDFGRESSYGGQSYGAQSYGDQSLGQSGYGGYGGQPYSSYGSGSYGTRGYGGYGREEERGEPRSGESFGQQLRETGQRFIGKVKRAFRGPKGYRRSDDRIREDVNDRLSEQYDLDPSEIEVSVTSGEVTLTGRVETRRDKFLAEEIADDVNGVTDVHNQLRVGRAQTSSTTGTAAGATQESANIGGAGSAEASRTRNARAQ